MSKLLIIVILCTLSVKLNGQDGYKRFTLDSKKAKECHIKKVSIWDIWFDTSSTPDYCQLIYVYIYNSKGLLIEYRKNVNNELDSFSTTYFFYDNNDTLIKIEYGGAKTQFSDFNYSKWGSQRKQPLNIYNNGLLTERRGYDLVDTTKLRWRTTWEYSHDKLLTRRKEYYIEPITNKEIEGEDFFYIYDRY